MDLIIEYLLEKGGVFGIILALAILFIFLREQYWAKTSGNLKQVEKKDQEKEVDKILYIVEDLKSSFKTTSEQIASYLPLLEQIYKLEKVGLADIGKIESKISELNNRIIIIENETKDLWDWHSVKDPDGMPIWYTKRSLEESVVKLEKTVNSLANNFDQIRSDIDDRLQKVNSERVEELKGLLDTYNKTVTDLIVALEKIKFVLGSKDEEIKDA